VFALALAVKVSAVTAVPQLAAALLAARLAPGSAVDWRSLRREGRVAAVAGAVGILVGLFVFWPTMWAQPSLPLIGLYTRMAGTVGDGVSLYLGSYYRGSALPWHYVPVWMAVATPLLTLCCAALGSLQLVRELRGERRVGAALVLASFFVPMALACSPRLPRYDGMRHFFFCVPALAMLAGVGLVWLSARAAAAGVPRALRGGAVAALLAWLALEVARGHPYQGSYVNEPTRWLLGPHVERMLVMEYWGLTYREGFAWLNAHAARGARVCIPVAGHLAGSYATREDLRFECGEEVDYVMEMASHPRRQADTRGRAPSLTVSRYDSDLMYLYRVR
jgi:hypothetical protein